MSISKRINTFSRTNNDTGFGASVSGEGGRFVNKDGSYNLRKTGISSWNRFSLFHNMLHMPVWKFIMVLVLFFVSINLLFTFAYLFLGVEDFQGILAVTRWQEFKELYFFSTETFTTVGYGRVNPIGDGVNTVASFEAMSGFLSFAVATGLIYGRFARPRPNIAFSENALISPYQDRTALMFRLVSLKDNHNLTDAEIKVTIALLVQENEKPTYKFYNLELERSRVDTLMMNWTVVHPINDSSPLLGLSQEDMKLSDVEIYVQIRGFDDVYSTNVIQRTSYAHDEIIFDAKFEKMYYESEDRMTTIVELDKLSRFAKNRK